jgi:putrescine carbamoyltransferase
MTPVDSPLQNVAHLRGRHYVTDLDYSREDLEALVQLAVKLKALRARKRLTSFLPGKHLAMIFEAASTRTRVSFENGFAELGGNALYLRPGEIHLPGRESIGDTAQTLSRMCDAIEIRSKKNETIDELAKYATVPVINGMDGDRHPVQSMSDALTIYENAGKLAGVHFTYVGDAAHPCNSLATTMAKLGMHVVIANAPGYEISEQLQKVAAAYAAESGGSFAVSNDPDEAVKDADFIYTDCWWWTGQEAEYDDRVQAFKPFQVNAALMAKAKPGTKLMHCLPAMRNEEVTDEVIDGPASIVFPQAENRMHFQKALMLALIGIDELPEDPDLQEIGRALLA